MITQGGIEAFLAIYRSKSISAAADELLVCQSALSVRLKTLEEDLGTTLFLRKQGNREVALTKSGQEFFEIALEYERVIARFEKMRKRNENKLNISSLNSLGAYILPESYELFMEKHQDVGLEIRDQELKAACRSILQGRTDLAFNASNDVPEKIIATPVFSEGFLLICSEKSDYPETVSANMLNVKNEVYVDWIAGFEAFHVSAFGDETPSLKLDIMSQLTIFVKKPNAWAVVPNSVARGIGDNAGIRILKTDFPLPQRTVYCLRLAESESDENSRLFLQCLRSVLLKKTDVICHLPDM